MYMMISKVKIVYRSIMDRTSILTDVCCMILSNMTRPISLVNRMITLIEQTGFTWNAIVSAFTTRDYNTTGAKLHYLGPIFSNLSQSSYIRRYQLIHLDFYSIIYEFSRV